MASVERLYPPLSHPGCIRLLNIDPATTTQEPISCWLEELDLEHHKAGYSSFSALSYRWGTQQAPRQISLNGHKISIRQNLYDFLVLARRNEWTRNFWIDGLCINQDDIEEKSQQVARMGQIYSRAGNVLIYLDNLSSIERCAIGELSRISDHYCYNIRWQPLTLGNLNHIQFRKRHLEQKLSEEARLGIEQLARHPYWSRKWIVQEILLAGPNASLVLGWSQVQLASIASLLLTEIHQSEHKRRHEITGDILKNRSALANKLRGEADSLGTTEFVRAASKQRETAWQKWKNEAYHQYHCCRSPVGLELLVDILSRVSMTYEPKKLSILLSMFKESECQEPADHIFALLSLATSDSNRIPVDYSMDRSELYWALLASQVEKEDGYEWEKAERNMVHTQRSYTEVLKHAMRLKYMDVVMALGRLWNGKEMLQLWELQFVEAVRNCISALRLDKWPILRANPDTARVRKFELDYEEARLFPPGNKAKLLLADVFLHVKATHPSAACAPTPMNHGIGIFDYGLFRIQDIRSPFESEHSNSTEIVETSNGTLEFHDSSFAPLILTQMHCEGHQTQLQHVIFQQEADDQLPLSLQPVQKQDVFCMFSGHQPALILRRIAVDKIVLGTAMTLRSNRKNRTSPIMKIKESNARPTVYMKPHSVLRLHNWGKDAKSADYRLHLKG
ncbi:hypothetical protein N0V90_012268 [Kalmusia sp. IMI 367209]|nr:hypothetical protein N0V90_012268 [Kalmusia sp. IMI 367209]